MNYDSNLTTAINELLIKISNKKLLIKMKIVN